MLTATQREEFDRRGLIRCDHFLPTNKLTDARNAIFQQLEKEGIWREGGWVLGGHAPAAAAALTKRVTNAFKRRQLLIQLIADKIPQVVTELLDGRPTFPMLDYPHLLFTMPNAQSWTVPHAAWHLDLPRLPEPGIPGVQIFTLLEEVAPGGGGTLVVTGSHQLLNEEKRLSSQQLKQRLKQEAYFGALMSSDPHDRHRFLHEAGRVGDVELQVVELHGAPGDLYFMDLRLLHAVAPNAAAIPRIMLTQRYLLEFARTEMYGDATL